ncbi:unnamed protein product [Tilletia laevis]|uniref:Uncharacterized protein n=3 Tax=Tilletia TaxID=13289 RepID=A0A8X7MVM2_9BASI|nr:hypothetical protein CF336_g4154 [Tilletia laevis]KAE8197469.1 hypothetical protein CF328_g3832 [Tilletia controversa]KAE8261533.1 hypothetical protein A4X03_0g3173 [Tilletia caries]KAE8203302.1 hypothetical protein CF335_g3081 [Tilletia laevis]KAE8249375.1 hypothetical protein A4X06_0g3259 [Tilletia controversa]
MRFAALAITTAAAFGMVSAGLTPVIVKNVEVRSPAAPNGLLQTLGGVVAGLEDALGITKIESDLYSYLKLNKVDDIAGITKLEESLKLTSEKSHAGLVQALGNVVANLEKKLGVTKIDDALSKSLGLDKLEALLGITKLEKVGLGL